ncbi:MAG TPA: YbaK/EbsC family protein [Clostridia bacterium]|nr:YbaK/EbsC family protein [Clostridia bacterium]
MSNNKVRAYFENHDLGDRVMTFDESSATVELAAKAVGCEPQQIVKTLTFLVKDRPIMVVCAGNVRVDNPKFKDYFGQRGKMIAPDLVLGYTGHEVGGVCPFVVKEDVFVYLDQSLKESEILYLGAGDAHSLVKLSLGEVETHAQPKAWVDVCKAMA